MSQAGSLVGAEQAPPLSILEDPFSRFFLLFLFSSSLEPVLLFFF